MTKEFDGIRLSPSAIISYMQCPRDFYYKYILRLPTPPQIQLIRGTIIHKALELFFDDKFEANLGEKMDRSFLSAFKENEDNWSELKLTPEERTTEYSLMKKQLDLFLFTFQAKMDILLESGKAHNPYHAYMSLRPKMREQWFEDKELNLCGYVDRIHTDWNGKVTITDYKTSSRYGTGLKDEHLLQCGIYALLYTRLKGTPPNGVSIFYLRYGEEVVTTVTPLLIQKALETVEFVHSKTKSDSIEDYPCSQHTLCSYSPWFNRKSGLCDYEDKVKVDRAIEEVLKGEEKS